MNLESIIDSAKQTLLKNGEHSPQIVVNTDKQTLLVLLSDFPEDGKDQVLFRLGDKIASETEDKNFGLINDFYFISEAWMSEQKDNENLIRPSLDPKRIEVLIISHYSFETMEYHTLSYEMIRKNGKVTDLKQVNKTMKDAKHYLLDNFLEGYKTGLSRTHTLN